MQNTMMVYFSSIAIFAPRLKKEKLATPCSLRHFLESVTIIFMLELKRMWVKLLPPSLKNTRMKIYLGLRDQTRSGGLLSSIPKIFLVNESKARS